MSEPESPRAEFLRWASYRGRNVRVTLSHDPEYQVVGRLMVLSEDGEVDVRGSDGVMRFCWPALDIELLEEGVVE